ncbi:hypothetical protein [Flavobacterium sp.]|uniref:hypothetical protein n=1 Tax=Flavobacterium sp. TaxID=239 RepID=UPI0022C2D045|nr:hypothetical protein [Flavobacterium sp.]MCZ8297688.1 hypothetical protein [Flavobacterium sp.]
MDIFHNEFKKSKERIAYEKEYILKNLSKSEVDGGITSVSLYDNNSTYENTTPFFRFGIFDTTLNEELVNCTFEWVAYQNLDWLIKDEFILNKLLQEDAELVYLIAYNQNDVYTETQDAKENIGLSSKLFGTKNWGKKEIINGVTFIAAPLMYFGNAYDKVISIEDLKNYKRANTIKINESKIIKIEIFPLYSNPKEYRKVQEDYWKKLNLEKQIKNYREATKIDFTEFLKRRSFLNK